MTDYFVVEPCASAGGFEVKLKDRKLDLGKCEAALGKIGEVIASTPVVLIAKINSHSISFYASGRMMIKGGKKLGAKAADALARKILSSLEKNGAVI